MGNANGIPVNNYGQNDDKHDNDNNYWKDDNDDDEDDDDDNDEDINMTIMMMMMMKSRSKVIQFYSKAIFIVLNRPRYVGKLPLSDHRAIPDRFKKFVDCCHTLPSQEN